MKRYVKLLVVALALFPMFVIAQEQGGKDIKVESFGISSSTNYALIHDHIVYDMDGEKCALIIVEARHPELLTFVAGAYPVMRTEVKEEHGEVWVYVPRGVKKLSIYGEGMNPLREYDLGLAVKGARTYRMKLKTNDVMSAQPQEIKVKNFQLSTTTNYANLLDYVKYDINGEKCALIIVDTRHSELLTFACGAVGIVATDYKEEFGQVWVYVPDGVRRLSIFGEGMNPLRDYDLGVSVQKARTYIMTLKIE